MSSKLFQRERQQMTSFNCFHDQYWTVTMPWILREMSLRVARHGVRPCDVGGRQRCSRASEDTCFARPPRVTNPSPEHDSDECVHAPEAHCTHPLNAESRCRDSKLSGEQWFSVAHAGLRMTSRPEHARWDICDSFKTRNISQSVARLKAVSFPQPQRSQSCCKLRSWRPAGVFEYSRMATISACWARVITT